MSPENPSPVSNTVEQMWRSTLERPLTAEALKPMIGEMRQSLIEAGVDLSPTPEKVQSLGKKKFRSLNTGRGPGVVAALGESKAESLLNFCLVNSLGRPAVAGYRGTEGRGLQQVAADTIQLLINDSPTDKQINTYVLRVNRRIKKDTLRKSCQAPAATKDAYEVVPVIPDTDPPQRLWQKFMSIPYDSLLDLWSFLST